LQDALRGFPVEVWSKWQNRAGYSLLKMSRERGSGNARRFLLRELGYT
jgi:hypothetical protein